MTPRRTHLHSSRGQINRATRPRKPLHRRHRWSQRFIDMRELIGQRLERVAGHPPQRRRRGLVMGGGGVRRAVHRDPQKAVVQSFPEMQHDRLPLLRGKRSQGADKCDIKRGGDCRDERVVARGCRGDRPAREHCVVVEPPVGQGFITPAGEDGECSPHHLVDHPVRDGRIAAQGVRDTVGHGVRRGQQRSRGGSRILARGGEDLGRYRHRAIVTERRGPRRTGSVSASGSIDYLRIEGSPE